PVTWRVERARMHRLLDRVLDADDAYRARRGARPVQVEMRFGSGDVPPVEVALPDGRRVRFRGYADRVDRSDDGRWIVLDYKTGKGDKYKDLDKDPFLGGTTLQLGLYAEAAIQHLGVADAEAHYWVVDESAGPGEEHKGYSWDAATRARFV